MGGALEFGKIVSSVWLKKYWHQAGWQLKSYLTVAVAILMLITSLGIFGFLSKAHLDQAVPTGDVAAKVAMLDERIKTERDNIDASRKALQQMDTQVDQRLSRSNDDKGAERAVQIRRQQAKERQQLQNEIALAQKKIAELNEERAPIASELRKVEAEVGPIKYVAALIYGDNPDANLLERAVRWVIIIIVLVFDPLAIALILAANSSMSWAQKLPPPAGTKQEEVPEPAAKVENAETVPAIDSTKYLTRPWAWGGRELPQVPNPPLTQPEPEHVPEPVPTPEPVAPVVVSIPETMSHQDPEPPKVPETAKRIKAPMVQVPETRNVRRLTPLLADNITTKAAKSSFGTSFPSPAEKGDLFLRVDHLPNKLFKFNGVNWMEVDKTKTDVYSYDEQYILFLIDKLKTGEYELDQLSTSEQELVAEHLNKQTNEKT